MAFTAASQSNVSCGTIVVSNTPNKGAFFDRFGNSYEAADLDAFYHPNDVFFEDCNSGIFTLQFQTMGNVPAWTTEEMMTVCSTFNYLSGLVSSGSNTNQIFIRVTKDDACASDGAGSPIWQNGECGITNSIIFDQIASGINNYPTGWISGLICIRSNPSVGSWHTLSQDCSPVNSCVGITEADLYTVILHEALHIVGFASLIGLDGSSLNGTAYSRWDKLLYSTNANDYLINPQSSLNCCDYHTFNEEEFPDMPTDLSGDCSMDVFIFDGTNSIAEVNNDLVVPATNVDMANKLSHLDNSCTLGSNFVMNPSLLSGTSNRILSAEEQEILCLLGYSGVGCNNLCVTTTNNDGPYTLTLSQGPSITITASELLSNDIIPSNATVQYCGSDPAISVALTNDIFTVSGLQPGVFTFCYNVLGCQGWCDEAKVTVIVRNDLVASNCIAPDCNLACFGDSEDFIPVNQSYWPQVPLDFFQLGILGLPSILQETNGNNVISLQGYFGGTTAIIVPLNSSVDNNCTLDISFDAAALKFAPPSITPTLEFYGITDYLPPSVSPMPNCQPLPFLISGSINAVCLGAIPISIDPDMFSDWFNGQIFNLSLSPYNLQWTNNSGITFSRILVVPTWAGGVGNEFTHSIISLDNLIVKNSCLPLVNITPSVITQCIGDQAVIEFEVCIEGTQGVSTPIDIHALLPSIPGISIASFGDFDQNGNASIIFPPLPNGVPVCTTLTLVLDIAPNVQSGTQLNISLEELAQYVCITSNPDAVLALEDCHLGFSCPCTGTNDLNIDAGEPSINPTDPILPISISNTEIPSLTVSSFFSPHTLYNTCIAVKGNLVLDNNFDLAIIGGQIKMQPGARIIVTAGARLVLGFINGGSGTEQGIHGCEQMWRSIEVQPGGTLVAGSNIVQDGEFAFDVKGNLGFITRITAFQNTFDRNHVGLRVNGGKILQPFPFIQNKFWATANLLPQFSSDVSNWNLQDPYSGIHLNSTIFTVGKESDASSTNEFDGLRNGILSNRSGLSVYYANFLHIQGILGYQEGNPNFNNSTGIGIFAKGSGKLVVKNTTFNNASRAVHTEGTALDFKNNLIQNVDVGLWNNPGMGQTISIYDNDIYFRGYGIYVGNSTTTTKVFIDRNDPLQTQPGNIDVPIGVWVNAGPSASTGVKRIANNQFNLNNKNAIGVWLNSSGNWRVKENHVNYYTPAGNDGTGQGISLSFSNDNYLKDNQVFGTGTDDKTGFLVKGSVRCTLCCNTTDNLWRGMQFQGECNPGYLRHNDMQDHNMGLLCLNGTNIGDQIRGGNTWTGTYGFASAVHGGSQQNIQNSEFYIEPSQFGSTLWPADISSPAFPGQWFRPDLSGMPSTTDCEIIGCPTLVIPPDTPESPRYPKDYEYQIASNTYGGNGAYSAMSQFEAAQSLYRNIRRGTVLTNNAPSIAQFYAIATNGTTGKFDEVERRIEEMWKPSNSALAQLDAYQNSIDNLAANMNRIDSLYAYALTAADTVALLNQKTTYFDAMQQTLQQWQFLMDTVLQSQQSLVPSIASLNNSTAYGSILVDNRKTFNRIYLETVALGNYTTTQAQRNDLQAVASQCFLIGGNSVLQARALYSALVAPLHINDEALCGSQLRPEGGNREMEQNLIEYKASIVPNPAQDQFSVQVQGASPEDMLRVQIIDLNGAMVYESTVPNGQVLTHIFYPGLYFCRIYFGEVEAGVVKLIVVP